MQDTIPARLFDNAARKPRDPAYFEKVGGVWEPTSWKKQAELVERAGRALMALGLEPGGHTAICGFNRSEWSNAALATMATGGAVAGIYTTLAAEEIQYVVHHAEAKIVFLETEDHWQKVRSQLDALPHLQHVVMFRGAPPIDDERVMSWEQFMARGDEGSAEELRERLEAIQLEDTGVLIYTSGTTGPPKGVMLTHGNLAWKAKLLVDILQAIPGDCMLSYLPLAHVAEQMATIHVAVTAGFPPYFAESIDKLADNLKEVRPTVFFGVPRVWEKFHAGITAKMDKATGVKAALAGWALSVGQRVASRRDRGQRVGRRLTAQHRLATRLVYSKVKAALGFDRLRIAISGAAPVSPAILELFAGLDIQIYEGYGQTESGTLTSLNVPGNRRIGSVGPALPGVTVRIADDDEILVKSPGVCAGYFKDPEATAELLADGWMHSGDLGAVDASGFVTITGRKKDLIITAGGKNITPRNLEETLTDHPLVAEAVVIGDRRKYLTALLGLDEETVERVRAEQGDSAVNDALLTAVGRMNAKLAPVEQIKKVRILPRNLSIEDGELTPTLKIKRNVVQEHFASAIESMYEDDSPTLGAA
jgi:long-chain acyl-CoA synthetase